MRVPMPLVALGLLALAPSAALAQNAHARADRNGDGVVDRREFHERMVDVFYFLDADKDGGLTSAEVKKVTPEAFGRADRNGDGKLQMQEFLDARAMDFDAADANDDAVLDPTESRTKP